MQNWIYWQKFGANNARSVSSYYNIKNEGKKKPIFESSFDENGPFKKEEIEKVKIGFK